MRLGWEALCLSVSFYVQTNVPIYLQNSLTDLDTVFCKGFVIHRRWFLDTSRCYGINSPEGAAINIFRSLNRVLAPFLPKTAWIIEIKIHTTDLKVVIKKG